MWVRLGLVRFWLMLWETMDAATTPEPEASQIHPNRGARASKSVISEERQLRLQSRGLVIREEK